MRKLALVLAASLVTTPATAQQVAARSFELRPLGGVYVPLGEHRDDFTDAGMIGLQGAVELSRHFHVLGNVSWAVGEDRFGYGKDRTDVLSYDVGGEANLWHELSDRWTFKPFLGVGAGGRSYDYGVGFATRSCTAAYAASGAEFQRSVTAFRFEARGYASCFEQPATGRKRTRVDATFALGLAYHFR